MLGSVEFLEIAY